MTDDPERVCPAPTIADVGSEKGTVRLDAPAASSNPNAEPQEGRTRKKRLQLSCGECRRKKVMRTRFTFSEMMVSLIFIF